MNTTELENAVRETCAIGDAAAYPDYTQARILRELQDKLHTVFEDAVVKARSGYWLQETTYTGTAGRNRIRIPHRACVQGIEYVRINTVTNNAFYEIEQVPPSDLPSYEGTPGRTGQPIVYAVIGDQIVFVPTPPTVIQYKVGYYIRPAKLVPQQSSSQGGSVRGQVTALDRNARTCVVQALPFDQNLAVPAAILNGQAVDIVHTQGWHEQSLVSASCTISGGGPFTLTFGASTISGANDPLDNVQNFDYVRASDQTDWPALPVDFHRCLVDAAGVKMLIELHLAEKSQLLAINNGNDLARFRSLLYPRVRTAPKQVGIMRRSRGSFPFGRPWG